MREEVLAGVKTRGASVESGAPSYIYPLTTSKPCDTLIRVMKQLSQEEFLNLIRDDVDAEGSQKALAAKLDVSEAYLSDVLRGRRSAGEKILSRYHLKAVTNYVPAGKERRK